MLTGGITRAESTLTPGSQQFPAAIGAVRLGGAVGCAETRGAVANAGEIALENVLFTLGDTARGYAPPQ